MSSKTSCCANHKCESTTTPKVACPHCLAALYCGEACRLTDWVKHACPNASIAPSSSAIAAPVRPYYYEDEMQPEVLAEEIAGSPLHPLLETHTVTQYTSNGKAIETIHPALVSLPAKEMKRVTHGFDVPGRGISPMITATYSIVVKFSPLRAAGYREISAATHSFTIAGGYLQADAIFKESNNTRIKRLMGKLEKGADWMDKAKSLPLWFHSTFNKSGSTVILWPDLSSGKNMNSAILTHPIPLTGNISFELMINDSNGNPISVEELSHDYDLNKFKKVSKLKRSFQKYYKWRLKQKLDVEDADVKNMETFIMRAQGLYVVFTVSLLPGEEYATMVDVEFGVPKKLLLVKTVELNQKNVRDSEDTARMQAMKTLGFMKDDDLTATAGGDGIMAQDTQISHEVRCDPLSISDCVGLAMALELKRVDDPTSEQTKTRERHAAVIRAHARNLMENPHVERTRSDIGTDIQASLYVLMNDTVH